MNLLGDNEIPIGLGMALAENANAMEKFSNMEKGEREEFVNRSRSVNSKQEMRNLVSSLDDMEETRNIFKSQQYI